MVGFPLVSADCVSILIPTTAPFDVVKKGGRLAVKEGAGHE